MGGRSMKDVRGAVLAGSTPPFPDDDGWVALSTGARFPSRINHSLSLSLSEDVVSERKVGFIEKTAMRHRRGG